MACSGCGRGGRLLATEAGAGLAHLTQRGQQFTAQASTRQHIQGCIDGLCREALPHVVRILAAEAYRNLLGRTPLAQVGMDIRHSHGSSSLRARRGCGLELPPDAAPYRRDTSGPARCARIRGSRCWGPAPTPSPSSATTGLGPVPGSAFHVRRYSGAYSISWTWQHRSPSGPAVLHLELELKMSFPRKRESRTCGRWFPAIAGMTAAA